MLQSTTSRVAPACTYRIDLTAECGSCKAPGSQIIEADGENCCNKCGLVSGPILSFADNRTFADDRAAGINKSRAGTYMDATLSQATNLRVEISGVGSHALRLTAKSTLPSRDIRQMEINRKIESGYVYIVPINYNYLMYINVYHINMYHNNN
eukprot:m.110293 g.110293  ORF g.110293 m.110293 type:complete len:153 (+) comp14034_c0_seq1:173-631(+)